MRLQGLSQSPAGCLYWEWLCSVDYSAGNAEVGWPFTGAILNVESGVGLRLSTLNHRNTIPLSILFGKVVTLNSPRTQQ